MAKLFSWAISFAVLALGVILGALNPDLVKFDAFFGILEVPLSVLLAISLVIGLLIGSAFMFSKVVYYRWQLQKSTKKNRALSDQLIQSKKENIQMQTLSKPEQKTPVKIEEKV